MAPLVFVVQGAVSRDWKGAIMFAIAIAVGITPEMLPMIVVCYSPFKSLPGLEQTIITDFQSRSFCRPDCQEERHRQTIRRYPELGRCQNLVLRQDRHIDHRPGSGLYVGDRQRRMVRAPY